MPTPVAPKRPRRVREAWEKLPKFVREVRSGRRVCYQLRIYVGPHKADTLNLGLYPSVHAALTARKEYFRVLQSDGDCLSILAKLKASGHIPAHVLPRWVERRPDGLFVARTKRFRFRRRKLKHGREIVVGPYHTPDEAYRAMAATLAARAGERGAWLVGWAAGPVRVAGEG